MPRETSPSEQVTYALDAQLWAFAKILQVRSHHGKFKEGKRSFTGWDLLSSTRLEISLPVRLVHFPGVKD